MQAANLVEGKQYYYDGNNTGGMDWFIPGSVVTITRLDGSETPAASGPAAQDNVGASGKDKGQIVQGYVRARNLHELVEPAVKESVDYHVSANPHSTTIVIQKRLSIEEIQAVIKAAGV